MYILECELNIKVVDAMIQSKIEESAPVGLYKCSDELAHLKQTRTIVKEREQSHLSRTTAKNRERSRGTLRFQYYITIFDSRHSLTVS